MPALPWTRLVIPEPRTEYVAMASRLSLARHRDVPRFLRHTSLVRRQLARADGLVCYSLDARLLSATFWTLSVWRDEEVLGAFAQAAPHRDSVEAIRPRIRPSTIVTWTVLGSEVPVTWREARERVFAAS